MGKKLSEVLAQNGFRNVLGMFELVSGVSEVEAGNPYTRDTNNGVAVVYDEEGDPWVMPIHIYALTGVHCLDGISFKSGAYVPFSNDGGNQIRKMFPRHYK